MRYLSGSLLVLLLLLTASGCRTQQPAEDTWTALYDGRDTTGWQHVGDGSFVVEDSLLRTEGGMGLLWYGERKLQDEVLRVEYLAPEGSNAGVFIRIPERPTEPWMPVDKGYEVQIDDRGDDFHVTGTLYSLTQAQARPFVAGDWNTMEIALDGENTRVFINGVLVTDYTEGEPVPEQGEDWEPERGRRPVAGYVGLQNHGGEEAVLFRSVSVRPLRPDERKN
ncbi:MAG TPA: DUF1080 domain-containing protein [Rhodothermales bacterium]